MVQLSRARESTGRERAAPIHLVANKSGSEVAQGLLIGNRHFFQWTNA